MSQKEVKQEDCFNNVYYFYQQYVQAEGQYLEQPTLEHWDLKEQAFEIFNQALLENQEEEQAKH